MPPKVVTKTGAAAAKPAAKSKYTLTYFNIRARGELCRLLFAQAGIEYKDVRIEQADWPKFKKETPNGTLPFLDVEGKQIGQSMAIARYLASEFGLNGKNKLESCMIDEYLCNIVDFMTKIFAPVFEKDEAKKAELTKEFAGEILPKFLKMTETKIGKSGWIIGEKISVADIALYDVLFGISQTEGDKFMALAPKVKANYEKVQSQPKIKAWLAKRPVTAM
ncbi:hematopoietic prostaglandin D synthase-like [Mizuhopecten yessoensis]|uniref:Hematopoietic prostaglandin D synthase n=1 Tax=Mizuhopecten yessoensis TaxID=6573 RepID=A0A210PWB6_MIZYE|nr:hematopoietic prostaglandin D synthase-like [Mizuhopecten yessoensis]OWF40797.1 Hematopoietic prostaglandin D synthase [Mizuhopecten yessoensis]